MNRDDIIRMAREVAGVTYPDGTTGVKIGMSEEHLERFANLVSAAEREACANVAAWILKMPENDVSAAIRARGQE
jgi:hypothetical protein